MPKLSLGKKDKQKDQNEAQNDAVKKEKKKLNLNMDIKDIDFKALIPKGKNKSSSSEYRNKDLNFLTKEYIEEMNFAKKRMRKNISLIIAILLLVGPYAFIEFQMKSLTEELISVTEELETYRETKEQQDFVISLQERIERKRDRLRVLEEENKSIIGITYMIEESIPNGVKLGSTNIDSSGNVAITATAGSQEQIASLIHNLRQKEHFIDIFVPGIQRSSSESGVVRYSFSLRCNFRR